MKVNVPGHSYMINNFEDKFLKQTIQFIDKRPKEEGSTELETFCDGTTNEEVLAVLIDRMNYMQSKFPCRENEQALNHLDEALMWLNKRTTDRINHQVEGKQIA